MKRPGMPLVFLLAALLSLGGCGGKESGAAGEAPAEITVFAAASLTESFTELGNYLYEKEKIKVNFNFAGSQALAASLEQGAAADVIATASESYMKGLMDKGIAADYSVFAKNRLVLCKKIGSAATADDLSGLAKDGITVIAADRSVPVGKYFYQVLDGMPDRAAAEKIRANIKSNEFSVKDVVAKIQAGQGDFGVVYRTDITSQNKSVIEAVAIPEFESTTALYPAAAHKNAAHPAEAGKFLELIRSRKGKEVLERYGFLIP